MSSSGRGWHAGQPRGPGLLQEGDRQGQEPGGGGAVVARASSPRASGGVPSVHLTARPPWVV